MIIEIIVPVFNEQFFLPFFLKHYGWVDRIKFLYSTNSNDDTLKILKIHQEVNACLGGPQIEIIDGPEPEGVNDQVRIDRLNLLYKTSKADWIMELDCDEFILINRQFIENVPEQFTLIAPRVFQAYPHVTDKPLEFGVPVEKQRRHGIDTNVLRPVIMRGKQDLRLGVGKHVIEGDVRKYSLNPWLIHWQMADVEHSINRRLGRTWSPLNKQMGWGYHDYQATEEILRKEFKDHENDPIVI